MTLNEFQRRSKRTMPFHKDKYEFMAEYTMGLVGESGEVVEHIKKHLYHGHDMDKRKIEKELGDVLHYVSGLAELLDLNLAEVGEKNIQKLKKRYPEGFSEKQSRERVDTNE